jgi:hypothetical protein
VAAAGQFSWPPAGSYMAVYGQFLVTVVSLGTVLMSESVVMLKEGIR